MAETRLTPEIQLDGLSPDEAFAVLGDETRLDIIRVLWEVGAFHEFDDLDDSAASIPFSDLRRRVDIEDNGRFNYHLSKLVPHFVRQTDDGYRLSGAGKKIARTVIAISGRRDPDVSEELETECPLCGAPIAASYEEQWLRFSCTECDGVFGDAAPEGTLLNTPFPPAGLSDRTPEEALATSLYRCHLDLAYMMQGVCRECAGSITGAVSTCDDHDARPGRPCPTCDTYFEAWGELRCETCQFAKRLPIEICVMGLTPVIGFLNDHDFDALAPSYSESFEMFASRFDTSVTDGPPRVTVTIEAGDDTMSVTLDEEMAIRDITRGAS